MLSCKPVCCFVSGKLQREGDVIHVIARSLIDLSAWVGGLAAFARDFS